MLEVALKALESAGRPLNPRTILRIAAREGFAPSPAPSAAALGEVLAEAAQAGTLSQPRKGVFAPPGFVAPPKPPPAPRPPERESGPRRARRRVRAMDMVGAEPVASLSVEAAVEEAEAGDDRAALRRRLWEKLRAQTAALVEGDPEASAERIPPLDDLGSVELSPAPRRKKRETPAPEPAAPLGDPERAYREERAEILEPPAERRTPALAELKPTDALVDAVTSALREAKSALSIDTLKAQIGGGARAAVRAENARCGRIGLRAPFTLHYDGSVGLSEWSLSARYLELEAQVLRDLAEQREIVRRDLLAKVSELSAEAFERLLGVLLEQMGFEGIEVVHRKAAMIALRAKRGGRHVAVVARRSWSPIQASTVDALSANLQNLGAARGLLIAMGPFTEGARAARASTIELVDGQALAGLLYDHGLGLAAHAPPMRYVDPGFFSVL